MLDGPRLYVYRMIYDSKISVECTLYVGYSFKLVIMKGNYTSVSESIFILAITCVQSANFAALWAVLVALYSIPRCSLNPAAYFGPYYCPINYPLHHPKRTGKKKTRVFKAGYFARINAGYCPAYCRGYRLRCR